jgi:hypothetical protein
MCRTLALTPNAKHQARDPTGSARQEQAKPTHWRHVIDPETGLKPLHWRDIVGSEEEGDDSED